MYKNKTNKNTNIDIFTSKNNARFDKSIVKQNILNYN